MQQFLGKDNMLERIDKFDTDPQSLARKAKIWTVIKWVAGIGLAIATINNQWPHMLEWATYDNWMDGFFAKLKEQWHYVWTVSVLGLLYFIARTLDRILEQLRHMQ